MLMVNDNDVGKAAYLYLARGHYLDACAHACRVLMPWRLWRHAHVAAAQHHRRTSSAILDTDDCSTADSFSHHA